MRTVTFGAVGCFGLAATQALAGTPIQPQNLECRDIRRLSDNHLLDLRIRMIFLRKQHTYARLENTGRGWQLIDKRPYVAFQPTRILLTDTPEATIYIERLTGDYYQIDLTGSGLSVWGRCAQVGGLYRLF